MIKFFGYTLIFLMSLYLPTLVEGIENTLKLIGCELILIIGSGLTHIPDEK